MKYIPTVIITFAVLLSCNQPSCPAEQKNPVLSQNEPSSEVYQTEIRRLIDADPEDVTYYFEGRDTLDGKGFLVVNCYGEDFCGQLWALLETDDRMTSVLKNQSGYRGAKLVGLKLAPATSEGREFLVYQNMKRIAD